MINLNEVKEENITREMMIADNIGKKILEAAVEIIDEEGYENLTIRKVAKKSGCSNSAIYLRFEDKDALAKAIASLHAEPFLNAIEAEYDRADDFFTNIRRIFVRLLVELYALDQEAINMQMLYQGSLKFSDSPFLTKLESYIQAAVSKGEIKAGNLRYMAFAMFSAFMGIVYMAKANDETDVDAARKMLDVQLNMMFNGVRVKSDDDIFWDLLKERGVNVDKALERMKGNKEAYRRFLLEFFEDPDFESLKVCIFKHYVEDAFDYAHGLKGMAANLGLEAIYESISVLVEILRRGSLDGAEEAYEGVVTACKKISNLL